MTLEDFFTLTEMRDGLSNLARVEELLLVIQNLKNPDTSDEVDALRQWSTVASTLSATKNEECLNQFLFLDGLSFLNKWLHKALNFSKDTDGHIVEELINSLLESFEKLPIDFERANTSGIVITIKHLLDHKCLETKDKARILYDKWNIKADDISGGNHLVVIDDTCEREEMTTFEDAQMVDISECSKADKESCKRQNVGVGSRHSDVTRCFDNSQPDSGKNEMISVSNHLLLPTSNVINSTAIGEADSSGSSVVLNGKQENSSVIEVSSAAAACASDVTCISHCSVDGGKPEESVSKDDTDSMKEGEGGITTYKSNQKDIQSSFSSSSVSLPKSVHMAVVSPIMSYNLVSKGTESCLPKTVEPQRKDEVNCHIEKCSMTTEESKLVVPATVRTEDIHGIGKINVIDDSQSCNHKMEAIIIDGASKELTYQDDLKSVLQGNVMPFTDSLKMNEGKSIKGISQKSEFGTMDDELEVARQVAIAVECEVVDYREPFCSSPDVNSMEAGVDCSPDSEDDERHQTASRQVGLNGSPSGNEDHSGSDSSTKEVSDVTQNANSNLEKSDQNLDSPELKTCIQESVGKSKKEKFDLDLNADFHGEELESLMRPLPDIPVNVLSKKNIPVNVSAPVAIIASSKGTPVLSFTPLHFEGELGWKGSAATSAFRPASPRRTPESGWTQSGSRQNSNFLEIDLNIAENEADMVIEAISPKQLPASGGLPSGDSSMEASSMKTERLKLDLNLPDDEDAPMYASPYLKINHQNVEQSLSSASSSSARQPSLRDFDLNDNPTVIDIDGSHYFDKSSSSKSSDRCGLANLDDPVITLVGSAAPPERKDFSNQARQSFLSNGQNLEHTGGTRPLMPYVQMLPGGYSYAGFPNRPGVSVPQPFYAMPGSISYMGPGLAQVRSSSVGFNGAPAWGPPFLVNISDAPSSSGLDLNSGTTSVDAGNLKQFLWQGRGGFVDAQAKGTQLSSSGIPLKRKEPECGLDSYPFGYNKSTRHHGNSSRSDAASHSSLSAQGDYDF